MRKSKKSERKTIILLVAVLLFMAVGFAAYSQTLNIGGGTGGTSSKATLKTAWNVHYLPDTLKDDATVGSKATGVTHNLTNTDFTFNVTLEKPGDSYIATWDVKNEGTVDAYLKKINMSVPSDVAKYVEYKITYGTTDYTATTDNLAIELLSGNSEHIKLTLTYKKPESQNDLPTTETNVTVSGSFEYLEKE